MSGSTFGTLFKLTTFGESHGAGIGAVIDGCPSGLALCEQDIQQFLDRRRPGQSRFTTPRKELDQVEILSGLFEGKTTGAPIAILVRNTNQISADYESISTCYRPGHADYTVDMKYGIRDYRGGGRSSGRETIGRVAAGAIASKLLNGLGVTLSCYTKAIGTVSIPDTAYQNTYTNILHMPNDTYAKQAETLLDLCIKNGDSLGGVIECQVQGMPVGVGNPVFEKLDANLAKAITSIGSVKGVEIGNGFLSTTQTGSQHNDSFYAESDLIEKDLLCKPSPAGVALRHFPYTPQCDPPEGFCSIEEPLYRIKKDRNCAGGILGGISDGTPIIIRAAVKPTPSISIKQSTINTKKENCTIEIIGRHDPCIVPRAVVVVESMVAITLLDALLVNMGTRFENVKKFYEVNL